MNTTPIYILLVRLGIDYNSSIIIDTNKETDLVLVEVLVVRLDR